jgi:DNA invertase Pin-like site-specific DNA recombinase
MIKSNIRVAIYTRVSSDEQAESGHGLNAQEDAARAYADRQGWEIIGVFSDPGISGSVGLEGRPGLLDAIAALGKGGVLLVAKRDRIGRLDPLKMAMIEAATARKGARIVSAAGEGTLDDDPSSILMRRMIDAFSEYEKLVIRARTKAALKSKRRRGEKTGGAIPYGFQAGPDKLKSDGITVIRTLLPCPEEQEIIRLACELRDAGETMQSIADEMNARGIKRREGAKWDRSFVFAILKRAA